MQLVFSFRAVCWKKADVGFLDGGWTSDAGAVQGHENQPSAPNTPPNSTSHSQLPPSSADLISHLPIPITAETLYPRHQPTSQQTTYPNTYCIYRSNILA
ncbi:hypothetical protein Nepgr_013525 [Nepenthes gracilis]|uniref:Uncharacterized protein n=1 Tax=Nepenthes gracilis TaxID=150966 RepID=A0AAD3XP84_NEPGR|nr:hypothetical protein Nepgr_013525 [Nepenthes gracilis]